MIGALPSTVVTGPFGEITGLVYFAPNSPWKPVYPPGSSGSRSGLALPAAHRADACAQCTPMPTKSVVARLGLAAASAASGEPGPNTFGTSGPTFSRIVLAAETDPTSQPARVNGTHGAGATLPSGPTIVGAGSLGVVVVGSNTPSVQYANVTAGFEVLFGLK